MEPGQKESVVFAETARVFAEEVQRMLFPLRVRDGVSQGRPRVPLSSSSGALLRSACSHGAWPWGDANQNVGALARAFGGGGHFFRLLKAEEREEGRLEDVSRGCRDRGGDLECNTSRKE
jgi:hypothetical protein